PRHCSLHAAYNNASVSREQQTAKKPFPEAKKPGLVAAQRKALCDLPEFRQYRITDAGGKEDAAPIRARRKDAAQLNRGNNRGGSRGVISIPTTPCNVAACDCISQYLPMRNTCALVAICDTPPWDDSNSDMLKDLAAGCAARRRRVRTASKSSPTEKIILPGTRNGLRRLR
ncbi:MAG TPA: hypothetical protein VK812_19760, partial [Candidatus Binatus sp.]|nr:hypothetical protein [Candidatus Binatus sp.]